MTSYKDAGVNIEKGNETTERIKKHVKSTFTSDVLLDSGLFAGAIDLKKIKKFKNPVLLASIDGAGTKIMISSEMEKWNTIGQDLVNHSVNDILCHGAIPLVFLDYIASSKLEPEVIEEIVKGMALACKKNNVALIAGETAEMPGTYSKGETDIAGTIIGVAEKEKLITGKKIKEKDVLIGLPSTGLHTNGYSLARKIIKDHKWNLKEQFVEGTNDSIGEALLKVHKSYLKEVNYLKRKFELKGIAHITGGGLIDNLPRILPLGLGAVIRKDKINTHFIFKLLQEKGGVLEEEMFRTFNMGVGMVLIVSPKDSEKILLELKKQFKLNASVIGEIVKGKGIQLEKPLFKD